MDTSESKDYKPDRTTGSNIVAAIVATIPLDRTALREKMEVKDDLPKTQFDLTEELKVVMSVDEKAEQSDITAQTKKMSRDLSRIGEK